MNKWQSKDLPLFFTMLGILVTAFANKIEELTSMPFFVVACIALIFFLIPLYIWISDWFKTRK